MTEYLNYSFNDTPEFINTYDELPLWSAPFGLLLLEHIEMCESMTVLDIGSGAGFPLTEIAGRLGNTSSCYGLDIWTNANNRASQKVKDYDLKNVQIIEGNAEKIPFEDNKFDLIVSNLGINNFDDTDKVFKECFRVLKTNGKLCITTNLNGQWKDFYNIFIETLHELNRSHWVNEIIKHQEHRGSTVSVSKLFTDNGFKITKKFEEEFDMRFLNGSAFFNHHFIQLGFLTTWKDLLPESEWKMIFSKLEENLNAFAAKKGELKLNVPMLFIEGEKN